MPFNIDELIADLLDSDVKVRRAAALKFFGAEDEHVVEPAIKALDDEDGKVRFAAAHALEHFHPQAALPLLMEHLKSDPNGDVRALCASALAEIGGDEAMNALIHMLQDPHPHVRMRVVHSFARHNYKRAVSEVEKLLDDEEWYVARSTVEALIEMEVVTPHLLETIDRLRGYPEAAEEKERNEAIARMLRAVVEEPSIIGLLTKCADKPISEVEENSFRETMGAEREKIIEVNGSLEVPPMPALDDLERLARKICERPQ